LYARNRPSSSSKGTAGILEKDQWQSARSGAGCKR